MEMPKIVVNDKELYTDDFNEEQMKIYEEIIFAKEIYDRLKYQLQVLELRMSGLSTELLPKENEAESDEETSS
jgi:hypothetical protein